MRFDGNAQAPTDSELTARPVRKASERRRPISSARRRARRNAQRHRHIPNTASRRFGHGPGHLRLLDGRVGTGRCALRGLA